MFLHPILAPSDLTVHPLDELSHIRIFWLLFSSSQNALAAVRMTSKSQWFVDYRPLLSLGRLNNQKSNCECATSKGLDTFVRDRSCFSSRYRWVQVWVSLFTPSLGVYWNYNKQPLTQNSSSISLKVREGKAVNSWWEINHWQLILKSKLNWACRNKQTKKYCLQRWRRGWVASHGCPHPLLTSAPLSTLPVDLSNRTQSVVDF